MAFELDVGRPGRILVSRILPMRMGRKGEIHTLICETYIAMLERALSTEPHFPS